MDEQRRAGNTGPVPVYRRLKTHIIDQIASGRLRPGQRIPSEGELVKSFAVSRMTANRALRELENEGLITRVQGVGSFVAPAKSESTVLEIRNVADEIRAQGREHKCLVVQLGEANEPRINRLLGLPEKTAHYRSVLVHYADDLPLQLEDRRVNPAFAPDYMRQDFTQLTPNAHLMARGGLQYAEHVVEAELPSPEVARLLKIRRSEPCIVLRRRTFSLGMVASFAVITAPSSRYRYTGRFGSVPPRMNALPPI